MNTYLLIKALHLISVVSWFAGLLYIVRLFIYHREAQFKNEPERSILQAQFTIMERRLWHGITWPAMIATAFFGTWLMIESHAYETGWFQLKVLFLIPLFLYHLSCGKIRQDLLLERCKLTSKQLRIWNEVATLLLFAIVFTAVMKSPMATAKGMAGLLLISVILIIMITLIRKRNKKT